MCKEGTSLQKYVAFQGAMQDLNNLQSQVYSGIHHQRVSVASQIRPPQHIPPHLTNSPAYPALLSPPHASESLLRSNSDSSLHQNLLHGGKAANNRKGGKKVFHLKLNDLFCLKYKMFTRIRQFGVWSLFQEALFNLISEAFVLYLRKLVFPDGDDNKIMIYENDALIVSILSSVSAPVEVGRMDPSLGVNLYGPMRHSQELQNRPKSGCELTHPTDITEYVSTTSSHPLYLVS